MTGPAEAIRDAARLLADARVASPANDARQLMGYVTGRTPIGLLGLAELSETQQERYWALVHARAERVPLQHLTGRARFRNVELAVGPGVFIPRPETELVAQAVINEAVLHPGALVVELCAGSGAISAAVADEVPGVHLVAIEDEPAATAWLARNLAGSMARIVQADIAEPRPELTHRAHVVVANPPYVPLTDRDRLPPEVRDHDPAHALFAGPDGLAMFPVVCLAAGRLLRPSGLVVVEHGDDQQSACARFLSAAGFAEIGRHRDLAGRPRFVTGRVMTGLGRGPDIAAR